jgi:hypothetical protein
MTMTTWLRRPGLARATNDENGEDAGIEAAVGRGDDGNRAGNSSGRPIFLTSNLFVSVSANKKMSSSNRWSI